MHVAIGIGTLLLGSWVLNAPVDDDLDDLSLTVPPPSSASDAVVPAHRPTGDGSMPQDPGQMRYRPPSQRQQPGGPAQPGQQPGQGIVPTAPTSSGAGGMFGMPMAPTGQPPSADGSAGATNRPLGSSGMPMPTAPTFQQPTMTPSSGGQIRPSLSRGARSSFGSRQASKAFASHRMLSSGVSPYMNLFRNDTAGGTVDNYNTLVRPQLDQNTTNQRFGQDIFGLERSARIQKATLQRWNSNRTLQGVGTPQYYMNRPGSYGP